MVIGNTTADNQNETGLAGQGNSGDRELELYEPQSETLCTVTPPPPDTVK